MGAFYAVVFSMLPASGNRQSERPMPRLLICSVSLLGTTMPKRMSCLYRAILIVCWDEDTPLLLPKTADW